MTKLELTHKFEVDAHVYERYIDHKATADKYDSIDKLHAWVLDDWRYHQVDGRQQYHDGYEQRNLGTDKYKSACAIK